MGRYSPPTPGLPKPVDHCKPAPSHADFPKLVACGLRSEGELSTGHLALFRPTAPHQHVSIGCEYVSAVLVLSKAMQCPPPDTEQSPRAEYFLWWRWVSFSDDGSWVLGPGFMPVRAKNTSGHSLYASTPPPATIHDSGKPPHIDIPLSDWKIHTTPFPYERAVYSYPLWH